MWEGIWLTLSALQRIQRPGDQVVTSIKYASGVGVIPGFDAALNIREQLAKRTSAELMAHTLERMSGSQSAARIAARDVSRENLGEVREIAFQPTDEPREHVPAAPSLDAPDLLQQSAIYQARRIGG